MKQMFDIGVFDNDERILINNAWDGSSIAGFTKSRVLSGMAFARSVAAEQDVIDLLDGLIAKIERMTDEEWDALRVNIPFETYYDAESNVDEVPADEEV